MATLINTSWDRAKVGSLLLLGVGFACAAGAALSPSAQAPPPARPAISGLIVEPRAIRLGTIAPGRTAQASATLRNPGTEAIEVAHFDASCPCVRVTPDRLRIAPGQSAMIGLTFDPADEPDFRGSLAVEVIGRSPDGSAVARGIVRVEVKSSADATDQNREATR